MPTDDGRFRCTYTPDKPGFYRLEVTSKGSHVCGSPFSVQVTYTYTTPVYTYSTTVYTYTNTVCTCTTTAYYVSPHKACCSLWRLHTSLTHRKWFLPVWSVVPPLILL